MHVHSRLYGNVVGPLSQNKIMECSAILYLTNICCKSVCSSKPAIMASLAENSVVYYCSIKSCCIHLGMYKFKTSFCNLIFCGAQEVRCFVTKVSPKYLNAG